MAITTLYRGIEYRSRLEARWAAFFAGIGWHYTYEPFDGDGYIPDFLIHGDRPLLIEVKPAVTLDDYRSAVAKSERGLAEHWRKDILVVGADPLPLLPEPFYVGLPAGLLGEFDDESWQWDNGNWFRCGACGQVGVFHTFMTYAGRPCGHYEGDHYLNEIESSVIADAWAGACNDVKWRGRPVGGVA